MINRRAVWSFELKKQAKKKSVHKSHRNKSHKIAEIRLISFGEKRKLCFGDETKFEKCKSKSQKLEKSGITSNKKYSVRRVYGRTKILEKLMVEWMSYPLTEALLVPSLTESFKKPFSFSKISQSRFHGFWVILNPQKHVCLPKTRLDFLFPKNKEIKVFSLKLFTKNGVLKTLFLRCQDEQITANQKLRRF